MAAFVFACFASAAGVFFSRCSPGFCFFIPSLIEWKRSPQVITASVWKQPLLSHLRKIEAWLTIVLKDKQSHREQCWQLNPELFDLMVAIQRQCVSVLKTVRVWRPECLLVRRDGLKTDFEVSCGRSVSSACCWLWVYKWRCRRVFSQVTVDQTSSYFSLWFCRQTDFKHQTTEQQTSCASPLQQKADDFLFSPWQQRLQRPDLLS